MDGSETQQLCLQPNELKLFLQGLHTDILKDVDSKIFRAIDGLLMEIECRQRKPQNGFHDKQLKNKDEKPAELPPKKFVCRNSTLTDLWRVSHVQTVFNIFLSLLLLLYLYVTASYFLDSRKFKEDIATVLWTFSKFDLVLAVWFLMISSIIFIVYPVFKFWSTTRIFSRKTGLYDYGFCFLFFLYQMCLLILPASAIVTYDIPIVSSFIIVAEQTRLMMKSHAFVRENASRALAFKPHQDGDKKDDKPYPEIEKLLYFLFVPTLVYRDVYPRTPNIRWKYVMSNFLQVFGCILGAYIPCTLFIVDTFKNVGREPIPLVNFMAILAVSVFAGGLLMFLVFYGMFHCWLNAFAEMLRFGDRMFYQDWWNCTSFAKFYRTWNMVVYDWLYSYVYRDMYTLLGRNRVGAMLFVFIVSAIIHEYILAVCFKFVLPFLLIMFLSFGVILVFVTRRRTSNAWNVFLWIGMFQGWGLLTVFYSMEWYSRINCSRTLDSWLDFVWPRFLSCNVISLPS